MKCPSCGTEGLPNRKFCGVCGHAFPEQSVGYATPPGGGGYTAPPSGSGGYSTPPSGSGYTSPPSGSGYTQPPSTPPYSGGGGMGMGYGASYGAPVEQRYKALRIIAVIYKVLAFVAAGLCTIFGLIALTGGASASRSFGGPIFFGGFLVALIIFIYGALAFVFLYGTAEFINLFISIEENTRVTNELLQRRNT